MTPRLIIASGNRHKVEEISSMLADAKVDAEVLAMSQLGEPPVVEETETTFGGNARLKCEGIARWVASLKGDEGVPSWVLADDSGLCVDALEGAPGVYSARYAGVQGDDAGNNRKLVAELTARGLERSPARFVCVLALQRVGRDEVRLFEGVARGEARVHPSGEGGFGYDPHVWLDGVDVSFAEMSREVKAKLSHRGEALRAFIASVSREGLLA